MSDTERTIEHLLAERPWQTYASLKRAVPSIRRSTLDGMAEAGRVTRHDPGGHAAVQYGPRGPSPLARPPKQASRYNTGHTGNVVAWLTANQGWHRATSLAALTGYEYAATLASNLEKEGRIAACVLHDGRKAFAALGTPVPSEDTLPLAAHVPATPTPTAEPAQAPNIEALAAALTSALDAKHQAREAYDAASDACDRARDALIAAARGGA